MIRIGLQISLLLGIFLCSCSKDPVGNNPPTLTYEGLLGNELVQGLSISDSIFILLRFGDIDGDLNGVNDDGEFIQNITIIDNRDGSRYISRSLPELPINGRPQTGSMRLTLPTSSCIYPPGSNTPAGAVNPLFPENKFTVDVYMEDLAGNQSNSITTDTIVLLCL